MKVSSGSDKPWLHQTKMFSVAILAKGVGVESSRSLGKHHFAVILFVLLCVLFPTILLNRQYVDVCFYCPGLVDFS